MSKPTAAPALRKPKLLELDIVRAIAIFAVVLIHATSSATVEPAEGSLSQILFYCLNLSGSFAVPAFIVLSGVVLFYSYDGKWSGRTALAFYRKRAVSLVIPYLIWAFFYYSYNQYLNTHKFVMEWSVFWRMLRWAEWSYHSYFMLIILQMYVLFPLLMTLVARTAWFRRWMIVVGMAIQAGFYVYRHWFGNVEQADRIAPTYIGYFLIGGAIGLAYPSVKAWVDKRAWLTAGVMITGGGGYMALFLFDRYKHMSAENTWFEVARFVYVIGACLFLMQAGRFLLRKLPRLSVALTSIGICSFGIYLIHPALLSAVAVKTKAPTSILMYDAYTLLLRFGAVFIGSWLLVYLYGKGAALFKKQRATEGKRALEAGKGLSS